MRRHVILFAAFSFVALLFLIAAPGCNQPQKGGDGLAAGPTDAAGAPAPRRAVNRFDLPDITVVRSDELSQVEAVLAHRAAYHRNLRQLRDYYDDQGYDIKRRWAEYELEGFEKVKPYRYVEEREIPAEQLHPTRQMAEADAEFDRGVDLMRQGGHGLPVTYKPAVLAEAYRTLVSMIERYPSSDKIDDAAFLCGELLKEYFPGHEATAARWYDRTYAWNPDTDQPARFRAAVLYEFRLNDPQRALPIYHEIIARQDGDRSTLRFCHGRVAELTAAQVSQKNGEPASEDEALFGTQDDAVPKPPGTE